MVNATLVNGTWHLYLGTERTNLRVFLLVVDVYLAFALIVLGLAGNTVSILVLHRDTVMRSTTRLLLQVLAVTDLLHLIFTVLYQPMFALAFDPEWGRELVESYLYMEPYISPLVSATSTAGTWIIVLVTLDRYLAICYPLHAKIYFTKNKIYIFVVAVWIFAIAFNAVRFSGKPIAHEHHPETGEIVLMLPTNDLQYNPYYALIYQVILVFLFRFVIPITVLFTLNVLLLKLIRNNDKRMLAHAARSAVTTTSHRTVSKRSTLMVVVVVSVFLACLVPNVCVRIMWLARIRASKTVSPGESVVRIYDDKLVYAYSISKLFLTLNSSINFVVYVALGRRFRGHFLRVITCNRHGDQHTSSSSAVSTSV